MSRKPLPGWTTILRELRVERGLKFKDAAAGIGIDTQHLSTLERCCALPNLALAFKVARFYKKRIEELWVPADEPTPERADQPKLFGTDSGGDAPVDALGVGVERLDSLQGSEPTRGFDGAA